MKMATTGSDPARELLRHTVATLAYRGGKVLRAAPEGFAEFKAAPTSRTAGQILAHICDLLDWVLAQAKGKEEWHNSEPLPWEKAAERFFAGLQAFDAYLASDLPLGVPAGKLFQGGIADALTHVGQLAFLRRLAGAPVRGENYSRAEIVVGRVGPEQSSPKREFD
jgi:hypothetical protein